MNDKALNSAFRITVSTGFGSATYWKSVFFVLFFKNKYAIVISIIFIYFYQSQFLDKCQHSLDTINNFVTGREWKLFLMSLGRQDLFYLSAKHTLKGADD